MNTFFLRVRLEGGDTWQEIEIHESIVIGRSEDCDYVIEDRLASRKHAQISVSNNQVYITDLGSSNGTKILGQRIVPNMPRKLGEGDYFSIGHALCQVVTTTVQNPYRLWYRIGEQPWQETTFSEDIVIGRGDDVGLKVHEGHISRNHAMIRVAGENFYLQDLGSQNGTFLEGQRIATNQPVQIYPGQYFKIGRATFTVVNEARQVAFHQTVADHSSEIKVPVVQADHKPRPLPSKGKSKKNVWPWLLGIGGILSMCVCVVVIGGLYLLDRAAGVALEEIEQASDLIEENQEELGEVLEQGVDIVENSQDEIPEVLEDVAEETNELSESVSGAIQDVVGEGEENTDQIADTGRKWLVMLYQNADDETLEYDITFDVNTAEKIGSTDEIAVVAQLDRFEGSYSGDGDWSGSRRYYLTADGDLDSITSTVQADLGEVDSGDVNTLVDFTMWAIDNYPADNYILIMSDHGAGWFGGYTDGDNGNEEGIYLPALESALQYITAQSGIGKFDILGFDACLMAELEVWSAVAPYASVGIASEESESATGWAYAAYLQRLISNPSMNSDELATAIVETFVEEDLAYELYGGNPSSVMRDSTLSAIRLDSVPTVMTSLDTLSVAMQQVDQALVAEARTYTRSYLAFDDFDPFYLDLVHFAQMVCSTTNDIAVCGAATGVEDAVTNAIIVEKHGSGMDGSNGVSFYFPDADFFEITKDNSYGYAYRAHAVRFTEISTWDEFLDFHYQIIERMP